MAQDLLTYDNEENEITGERNLTDKLTALKNLAKSYEMRCRGYRPSGNNDKWQITGKALAGTNFINQSTGILMSFAEPANLITTKLPEKFQREMADAFFRVNVACLNDETITMHNYRTVIKMFKDTMSNIGDIIVGSKGTLSPLFRQQAEEENQNTFT